MNQCPQCRRRLEPFAIKCDHCRWRVAVASDTDAGFPASAPSVAGADSAAGVSVGREYERGMELLEAEDFQSAVAHFNRAIVVAPVQRLGELYSLRGYCYLKQSDFHRAEKDCTDAIALNCCDPQTYAWRAASRGEQLNWPGAFDDLDTAQSIAGDQRDTYLDLMASYAAIAGDYYRQQIESGSESADLMFERGWVHLRMGKYENAFNEFQSAIKLQRDHPWAFTGLAKLWIEGRINASFFSISNGAGGGLPTEFPASDFDVVRWCDRGVKGDVLCRRAALEMRSRLYLDQGQLDQAKADLATLLNLAGDDPDARLACCQLWFEMDQAMPAVTELNKILHDHPENPKALLLRARCFATVKNYSLAIDDFRRYLSAHPDDHAASVELGNVFLATHQINEAAKLFESAINAVGNNFESYHGLSRVFLKRNQLDEALTQCLKAIRIDNRCAEVFATEAEIYLRLGDDTRAIDSYSRAARIASSDASKGTYLYLRGAAYYSLNKFSEALCDFQLSCLLRPNHAGALVWKAAACARKEYWTQAIVCLNRAIEIRPDAAQQYQQLGQPLAQKAIKHFDKKLSDNANDANAYRDRAMANQFIGMYASSIEDLTMALDLASGSVSLLIQRGRVYAATGDHRSAIKDFTRALKIDRRNHLARFYRAQSRVQCGHLDRAQRDIQKAIRINSCRPAYHQLLADVFLESGRLDQVVLSLDRSILLDSTDVAAFQLRGEIQSRLKNYFAAVSDFTRALELEPVKTELLVARAQALAKAEKHAAAIEDFERALSRNSLLVKAYCGRALSLASIERQEYATIWLTKSFHRFKKPRDLAELLFARGKIFYQMVLYGAATIDFTAVAKIMRNDPKVVAAAKYARAIARVHAGQRDLAEKDFHAVLEIDPQHDPSRLALHWMSRRDEVPLPPFLVKPVHNRRPTRPPVVRSQVVLTTRPRDWRAELPYDTWVLRTLEKKEYGPIQREVLDRWVQEGRIDFGMKLLRADWSKWQRVEKIFKELLPAKVNGAAVPAPVFPMVRQHKAKTKAGCDANPSE